MKKIAIVLCLLAAIGATEVSALSSGSYRLGNVKRLSNNFYKDTTSGLIVETKYCWAYAYGEEAILKWEGEHSWDNKLIFVDSGEVCDVKDIH